MNRRENVNLNMENFLSMRPFSFETFCINFIRKNINTIFIVCITLLSLAIRLSVFPFISRDMSEALLPWYMKIEAAKGLPALRQQVGDYNVLCQFILALMTYVPFLTPLYKIKILSVIFDYVLALGAGSLTKELAQNKIHNAFIIGYTTVLFLPTVLLNSAAWGQADAIYSSLLVWCFVFLWKRKTLASSLLFGIALSIKLQSVFLLPFILVIYFINQDFSAVKYFVSSLIAFCILLLPAIFAGRPITEIFSIYAKQTDEYHALQLNYLNLWYIFAPTAGEEEYNTFKKFGILLTFAALGIILYLLVRHIDKITTLKSAMLVCIWLLWTTLLLLPSMHERYGYFFEVLLCIYAVIYIKKMVYVIAIMIINLMTYGNFLLGSSLPGVWAGAIFYRFIYEFRIFRYIQRTSISDTFYSATKIASCLISLKLQISNRI